MLNANYFTKSELDMFNSQDPIFSGEQMKIINRKTPDSDVETKQDKSGFTYKSVKVGYIKALVSLVSGGNFSFEIKSREFIPSTREILVEGRLTMHVNGKTIVREQFGQHHINVRTEVNGTTTNTYASDIGNGYKAAASDAFKKCASELGFCWDIYNQERADTKKEEQPELDHAEKKKLERLEHFLKNCKTGDDVEHVYIKYLETAEETEASKAVLTNHMERVLTVKKE